MTQISVIILTLNEEERIAHCIHSIQDIADEILIVDSFSNDRTIEIAKGLGAKVIEHKFEGFIEQRKFGIEQATHSFILALDADESPDDVLRLEILKHKNNPEANGYFLNRLSSIGNKWIHHGSWHPDWKLRLFFRDTITVEGMAPHDEIRAKPGMQIQKLAGKLLHYSDVGLADRIQTINKYSTIASLRRFEKKRKTNLLLIIIKPGFRFLSEYFFQLGFLDGVLGFFIAITNAHYVFLREMKLLYLWRNRDEQPDQK